MDPISHLLKGSLFFLVLLKNCCVSLQTKFLSIVKREKEKKHQKTNIFTFTDCITTISYPNSNRGMNWMRIRTSWIDFEFGLSEKRPAAVDYDIELRRTFCSRTFVYYRRSKHRDRKGNVTPLILLDLRSTKN